MVTSAPTEGFKAFGPIRFRLTQVELVIVIKGVKKKSPQITSVQVVPLEEAP